MLEGKTTELRALTRDDLPQLAQWRNRPALRRYFREYREITADQQTAWYERVVLGQSSTLMVAVTDRESEELVGAAGLCNIDWVRRHAELSLYIGRDDLYVDEVYAPDAARVLLSYGFRELGLHRVWVETYAFDSAKQTLLQGLSFTHEATLRDHHFDAGSWHDSLIWGLLDSEYAPE